MGMNNIDNYMEQMAVLCENNDSINKNLYSEYGVKRGLRDENGQGVLTGLTNISDIKAFEYRDGQKCPCDGELSYRGYNIRDFVAGSKGKKYVFEEGAYLLLFGELPDNDQLKEFRDELSECMKLRGFDVSMSHQRLDGVYVNSIFQQQRSVAMAATMHK